MRAANALIDVYCQAWSDPSPDQRARHLGAVWSPGASYTDPTIHAEGAPALLDHITKVLAKRPGSRVVRTSRVDQHHGVARFAWRAIDADGRELPEGTDIAFLSADGARIERIIGFFGPVPRDENA
ncbi:MAG: nuclear transport factor 2 family protein [Rubrivivax sp.]